MPNSARRIRVAALLAASLVAAAAPAAAQQHALDRGSFILGGSTGAASYTHTVPSQWEGSTATERFRTSIFHFGPRVQYFFRPGLAVGAHVDAMHSRISGSGPSSSQTAVGAGPVVSYFFGSGEQRFVPNLGGQATYGTFASGDVSHFGYGVSGGVVYMLTPSVGLDASVFYRDMQTRSEGRNIGGVSSLGLAIGFSAFAF